MHTYIITIIQIITESLPISSSGHVALYAYLMHANISTEWLHVIHVPTIIIAGTWLLFYIKKRRYMIVNHWFYYAVAVVCADIVTTFCYVIKRSTNVSLPLWIGFGITGLLLLYASKNNTPDKKFIIPTLGSTLMLGFVQGIALLPGISRFAMVFAATRYMQFSVIDGFAITWIVALPLMAAAVVRDFYYLLAHGEVICSSLMMGVVLIASLGALITFYISLKLAEKQRLWWLSIYILIPMFIAWYYHI